MQAAGVSNKKDMLPGVSSSACDPVCAPLGGPVRPKRTAKELKMVPIERPVGTAFLRAAKLVMSVMPDSWVMWSVLE